MLYLCGEFNGIHRGSQNPPQYFSAAVYMEVKEYCIVSVKQHCLVQCKFPLNKIPESF